MPQNNKNFILNEIEIIYRDKVPYRLKPSVTLSEEAYELFRENWNDNKISLQEEFKALFLTRGNKVLGLSNISIGGVSGVLVDPKIIFGIAIKARASGIIVAHNHPSGNNKPSTADIRLTRKLSEGAKVFDMTLLDHLIITNEGYTSLSDSGYMPS